MRILCLLLASVVLARATVTTDQYFTGNLGDRVDTGFHCWNQPAGGVAGCPPNQGGVPLTRADAESQGYVRAVAGVTSCDPLYGHRFRHPDRVNPLLMFDSLGQLSGVQFEVNHTAGWAGSPVGFPLWPGSNVKEGYWFRDKTTSPDIHMWHISMYFADPSQICSGTVARSSGSIGDRLWCRTSEADNTVNSFERMPMNSAGIPQGGTGRWGWKKGGCFTESDIEGLKAAGVEPFVNMSGPFQAMGQHYWRQLTPVRESSSIALLYNHEQRLLGFIFLVTSVSPLWPTPSGRFDPATSVYEYPHQPIIPFFHIAGQMETGLLYLNEQNADYPCGTFSTTSQHIKFLDSSDVNTSACQFDRNDRKLVVDPPFTVPPTQQVANIRAAYGVPEINWNNWSESCGPGHFNLKMECDNQYAFAKAYGQVTDAAEIIPSQCDSGSDSKHVGLAIGMLILGLFLGSSAVYLALRGTCGEKRTGSEQYVSLQTPE